MMRIMLFNQSDNLYEKGFGSFGSGHVVVPSPQMADIVRRKISGRAADLDVITISKFLKDELSFLKGDDVSNNYRGKSELLLLLSSLWKKLDVPSGSYELFQRCFRLLTDLRSFSMSDDVLETALEHFDERIALGTMRMHQVLNQLDIYDEHRSYFQLSEQLRSGDLPVEYETERNLIFFGFDFLSASQVDLLKAYAIRDDVTVPVYQDVYRRLADCDWLSWLDGDDVEKAVLDEPRPRKTAAVRLFPKNYLSKSVKKALGDNQGSQAQIILGERHSSYEKIQQAVLAPSRFKSPADIIGDKIKWLCEELAPETQTSTELLVEELGRLWEEAVESQDFRAMKAVQLMKSILLSWRELSEDNEIVTPFDFRILIEALELDSPRVFQTSLGKKDFKVDIKSLKELEDLSPERLKIFCLSAGFSSPKGSLVGYTEGVERYLASIGPLRRAELEFAGLKEKLEDAVDEKTLFLVEEGVVERDQGWKSFFDRLNAAPEPLPLDFGKSASYRVPEAPSQEGARPAVSATRLQTYLDCPKKYLFKYLLKLSPDYVFEDKLDALELGRIQHALIENYAQKHRAYAAGEHERMASELLEKALAEKNVDPAARAEHELEIVSNTKRAIEELLKIKAVPGTDLFFEQKLKDGGVSGSVDCVVETEEDVLLLDFKRGAGSLPSQSGFRAFEKVQLWFYANHWPFGGKQVGLGYVCLSDMESSLLFFSNEEMKKKYQGVFGAKTVSLAKNFEELFAKYQEFEKRTVERLFSDKNFPAAPAQSKVCSFCELNKLCPRSADFAQGERRANAGGQ